MKSSFIELLNFAGTPTTCDEVSSVQDIAQLYGPLLLKISDRGLTDYEENSANDTQNSDQHRFVVAKNQQEKNILLKVEPIRCYLRDHQMNSKVVDINPYQSVRWLKSFIQSQRHVPVKLIINESQLTDDSESLLKYIYEDAIIHVIESRQSETIIPVLYTKQPGPQNKSFKLENIPAQNNVDWLAHQISNLTGVPYEYQYLVYGGKILQKDKKIKDYGVLPNSILYVADTRRYLRKVTRGEYENRLEQVRKIKQSNKKVSEVARQEMQRRRSGDKLDRKLLSQRREEKASEMKQEEDIKDYKTQKKNIQNQEQREDQPNNNELKNTYNPISPPNSPIYMFNAPGSLNRVNSELKQGRVVTTQRQVYQDSYGFTHEHSKQKTVYKDGKTKVVDVDVVEDDEGNILKVEQDEVNIKRDSVTGNTIKTQSQVIEDADNTRTVINKKQTKDSTGHVIREESQIFKTSDGFKKQRQVTKQGENTVQVTTQILQDTEGDPYKIQTDIVQTKEDGQGNITTHTKDIKQQDGVTQVVEKKIVRDKEGNVLSSKTDIIQITEDQQGNIYKHERKLTNKPDQKIIIERDIVTDSHGDLLSRQTNMKVIRGDSNDNMLIQQTDISEKLDGNTIVIEKNVIRNPEGVTVQSNSNMFELNNQQSNHSSTKHVEVHQQVDEQGTSYKYSKNQMVDQLQRQVVFQTDTITDPEGHVIMKQKTTTITQQDQNQNKIVRKTQTVEQTVGGYKPESSSEGGQQDLVVKKTIVTEIETITDPQGHLISQQTNTRTIQKDENKNTIIVEKNQVIDGQEAQPIITESQLTVNPQGIIIHSLGADQYGKVYEHERTEVEEGGVTKVTQIDTVVNSQGQIIAKEQNTKTYKQNENKNKVISQTEIIQNQGSEPIFLSKTYEINPSGDIIKSTQLDQNGNRYETNVEQFDIDNKLTVVKTSTITNPQGEVISKQVHKTTVEEDQQKNLIVHETDVIQNQNQQELDGQQRKKIVIQKQTVTDQQGNVIARETDTIITKQDQSKNTITYQTDIIQQTKYKTQDKGQFELETSVNKKSIIEKQTVTNQQGEIIKDQTNIKIIDSGVDKNTEIYQSNVIDEKDADNIVVVENNTVIDPSGNIIKQEGKDQQGNTYQYERNQQRQENKKIVVQTDTIKNAEGQVISKQIHTKIFEGDQENNIVIRDINQLKQGDKITLRQTDTYLDPQGVEIGKESKVRFVEENNRNNTVIREVQKFEPVEGKFEQTQRMVEIDSDGVILKSISINQDGIIHKYQRNQQQQQNKRTITVVDSYIDGQGVTISQQTNTRVSQQDENQNLLIKETNLLEQQPNEQGSFNKKVMVQKQTALDSSGRIIGQETNTKLIEQDSRNNQYIKQTDVIQQIKYKQNREQQDNSEPEQKINKTSVIKKQTLINSQGEVILNEMNMKVYEKDADHHTVIFETKQVDHKYADNKITTQNQTVVDTEGNVIKSQGKDEEGNIYKYDKQQRDQQGKTTIIQTDIVTNPDGHVESKQVNTKVIQRDQNQNIATHINDTIQQSKYQDGEEKKTKIIVQKQILTDKQGHLLGKQTTTKTIEEDQNKNTVVHETDIISEISPDGTKNVTSIIQKQIVTNPQGQILTNQTNIKVVEKDPNQNTIVFQNKVVQDNELDNRVQVQRSSVINSDGVVIKSSDRDEDGNLYEYQRKQVEGNNKVIVVETDSITDPQGDLLARQTNTRVYKHDEEQNLTFRETDVVEQRGDITAVQKIIQMDPQGVIISSYERDQDGTTHQYQRKQRDYHHQRALVQTETVTNPEGNVIVKQINRTILDQNGENNVYIESTEPQISSALARGGEILGQHNENKKITIERETVRDSEGQIIEQETTTKIVQKDENKNTIIHETNIISQEGIVVQIENNIVIGPQGQIIKSQCHINQLDEKDMSRLKQAQVCQQLPQVVEVEGQRQPLINGGTQITVDQLGNTHTHEKQLLQKQGKTTFVDRDTIQDPRGKLIRVQTDVVQIEGDDQGNMHKHKSQIVESDGKVIMIQTDEIMDPDGVIIRKQRDTIEIENAMDGSVHKHEKDVIQQDGKTQIIQKDIVEDAEGNVIHSKTLVTNVQDNQQKTEVHQTQQIIQPVEQGQTQNINEQITQNIEITHDKEGNTIRHSHLVQQNEGQKTITQKHSVENSQGDLLRQQTQVVEIRQGQPEINRHYIDYQQKDNKISILETASKQNPDGSIIREEKQTVEIQQNQDGTIHKKQMDVTYQNGKKTIQVNNIVEDQQGRQIRRTSNVIEVLPTQNQNVQNQDEVDSRSKVQRRQNIDEQGNTHIIQNQTKNKNGHEIQIQRQYVQDREGNIIKTQTEIIDVQRRQDGTTKLTAVDIIQEGGYVTVVQNDRIQDEQGNQIRAQSGSMQVHEIGGGIKKREQQNIIQQGGIKLRVQKQTYEDLDGNIIQQKVNTTQLIDKYDDDGNKITSIEGFKRKQEETHQDEQGNTHYFERQIVDNQHGRSTVIETEAIRNQQDELLQNSTDLIQMTEQLDGSIHRHEINIMQKPGKVTMAETNSIENADGERVKGQVQTIVVTTGQNGQKTKKQTTITMKNNLKTIVQKNIIEDADGNIISTEMKKRRVFIDENGVQTGRQLQTYQANQIQILGQPSTLQKQVFVDLEGVVHATQRLTTFKEEQQKQVVETTQVKVTQQLDGSINQQMSVTKVFKNQNGEIEVITTPIQIPLQLQQHQYTEVDSEIRERQDIPVQRFEQRQEVEREQILDESGNKHTYEKQVIDNGQKGSIIKSSEVVEDSAGHLVTINTNVVDTQILEDGRLIKHKTEVVSGQKVTTTQTYTIQNPDGSIHSEKTRTVEVTEDQGLIHTHRTDVTKQGGVITVDKVQTLEDEDGNLLDSSYNKLSIKGTEQAIREQAQKVAKSQIQGEVTGIVKEYQLDDDGNRQVKERETIDDHGKMIIVDSVTVENPDGQILKAQTDIVSQQKLQNGQISKKTAVITEQGGDVCVVQYTQIKDDDSNLQNLLNQQRMSVSREQNKLNDLLGLNESQEEVTSKKQVQAGDKSQSQGQNEYDLLGSYDGSGSQEIYTTERKHADQGQLLIQSYNPDLGRNVDLLGLSADNFSNQQQGFDMKKGEKSQKNVQFDLLYQNFQVQEPGVIRGQGSQVSSKKQSENLSKHLIQQGAQRKQSQLPIFSKKQLDFPEEYDIVAFNKNNGNKIRLRIRFDDNMDDVAEKLSPFIDVEKSNIKFYVNQEQIPEYDIASESGIIPEAEVQYREQ